MRLASYILIELAPGTSKAAAEAISKIVGVKMAHAVTGPFDIIAFAEVPDFSYSVRLSSGEDSECGRGPEDSDGCSCHTGRLRARSSGYSKE